MIHYEEKPHEGMRLSARGKCVWMTHDDIVRFAPEAETLFKHKPTEAELLDLKQKMVDFLTKKGYVFFDKILYRYITNQHGYLKQFSVNYHFIR